MEVKLSTKNMLTKIEYESLWNTFFQGRKKNMTMPAYSDYKKREEKKKEYIDGFKKAQKTIKFILLGECAPDTGNFIYVDGLNSYITAPLKAVGYNTKKKFDRINAFMQSGFLLIDLYPFAINYKDMRTELTENTKFQKLIHQYLIKEITSYGKLVNDDWDFCFVAPESTSAGVLKYLITHQQGALMKGKNISHKNDLLSGHEDFVDKSGKIYHNYVDIKGKMMPKIARLASRRGSTGPSADLIKRVLF
jgi:hypothetical protein